jgi:hypothetical protein
MKDFCSYLKDCALFRSGQEFHILLGVQFWLAVALIISSIIGIILSAKN